MQECVNLIGRVMRACVPACMHDAPSLPQLKTPIPRALSHYLALTSQPLSASAHLLHLAHDRLERGLVHERPEVTVHVRVGRKELGVQQAADSARQVGGRDDVSKGNILADQVGVRLEVAVKGGQTALGLLDGLLLHLRDSDDRKWQ